MNDIIKSTGATVIEPEVIEDDVGIVKASESGLPNGVGNIDNSLLDKIFDNGVDPDSAKHATYMLKSLEAQIEAAEKWGEYASQFCVLEFQMWVRIAKTEGSEAKLTATQKDTVSWLRERNADELDELLNMCKEGRRIRSIINDSRKTNEARAKRIEDEYERISDEIVNKLDMYGCTTLTASTFVDNWSNKVSPPRTSMVNAFVERTRNRLIQKGGRGVGDSGSYMLVEKCSDADIASIVETRLNSILADLQCLANICQETGFFVDDDGISALHDAVNGLR